MNERQVIEKIRCICQQLELLETQIATLSKDGCYPKAVREEYQQAYNAATTALLGLIDRSNDEYI